MKTRFSKSKSSFLSIILVIILLIIPVIVGLIAYATNGFKHEILSFYVTDKSNNIFANNGKALLILEGESQRFNINYTFNKDTKGYSVKVIPNVTKESDFYYIIAEKTCAFSAETNLSAGFDLELHNNYFVFTVKSYSIQHILEMVYPGQHINGLPLDIIERETKESLFSLLVTSYDGNHQVRIPFIKSIGVVELSIDRTEIVF